MDSDTKVVSQSRRGLAHMVLLQVLGTGVSFALNTLVIRRTAVEEYAAAAVHMHLVVAVIFMLTRDPIRAACLRGDLAISWLVAPLGLVACVLALAVGDPLFLGGALMELLVEPVRVQWLAKLHYERIAWEDALAALVRAVTTYLCVTAPFANGALAYGCTVAAGTLAILAITRDVVPPK